MLNRNTKIEALRGIAAMAVVLLHTQNAWYLGVGGDLLFSDRMRLRDHWLGLASIPSTFGFLGVNLFFLLSGLCIHLWWLNRQRLTNKPFEFSSYIGRRLTRLYPAYVGAILFSLLMLGLTEWMRIEVLGHDKLSVFATGLIEKTIRYFTFTHTLKVETFGGYNTPLYTMAIEFHFYILYPVVLYGFRKIGSLTTLMMSTVISITISTWVIASGNAEMIRLFLDSALVRWPEWILGCVMAEWLIRWHQKGISSPIANRNCLGLAAATFVLATVLQAKSGISPDLLWTVSLAPLVMLFLQCSREPSSTRYFWLCKLGAISYSLYLIHSPILRLFAVLLPPSPASLGVHLIIYITLGLPMIVLAAWGLFKLLEEPFLSPKNQVRNAEAGVRP